MQTSQFFAIVAMDVEHIDMYTPGTVVNFKRSEGTVVFAKILGPSEHGAEYRSKHACQQAFFTSFTCPVICLSCCVSRVPCIVSGGAREPSLRVRSLRGVREPSRGGVSCTRGAGGRHFVGCLCTFIGASAGMPCFDFTHREWKWVSTPLLCVQNDQNFTRKSKIQKCMPQVGMRVFVE